MPDHDPNETLPDIPIIDIAPLLAREAAGEAEVARKIGAACRGLGFFYITGHGVTPATMSGMFEAAARFFAAPPEVKDKAGWTDARANRGFIRMGAETLDPGKPPDIKESFNIGVELAPDDPELLARAPFRAPNVWPDVPGFRSTALDYFDRMLDLGRMLHRGFARDLGIEPGFFDDKLRKPMATLRLLHYPASDCPPAQDQLGAGVHTDYGNVTLLATDAIGGLMVRDRNGRWLAAPVVPGAYVCNIGDCLMRWTNNVYVSTPHKVETPLGKERYSIAFFVDPDPDAIVACLPTCADKDGRGRYPAVTAADFLKSRLEPTYAHVPQPAHGS